MMSHLCILTHLYEKDDEKVDYEDFVRGTSQTSMENTSKDGESWYKCIICID